MKNFSYAVGQLSIGPRADTEVPKQERLNSQALILIFFRQGIFWRFGFFYFAHFWRSGFGTWIQPVPVSIWAQSLLNFYNYKLVLECFIRMLDCIIILHGLFQHISWHY